MVLSGIRPSFPSLSRSAGQITHVLLTRSPLEHPHQKMVGAFPFDLHVLSTPPAFVLSQDQTLQKNKKTNRQKTKKPTKQQQTTNTKNNYWCSYPCSCSNKVHFIKWHTIEFSNNTTTHNPTPKTKRRAVNSDHTNIQTPPQNHKPPAHNNKNREKLYKVC